MSGEKNLINLSTRPLEERRRISSAGGYASKVARKEKKYLSHIYSKLLMKRYKIKDDAGMEKTVNGEKFILHIMEQILSRCDASSVRLLSEIRSATEPTNIQINHKLDEDVIQAGRDLELMFKEKFGT